MHIFHLKMKNLHDYFKHTGEITDYLKGNKPYDTTFYDFISKSHFNIYEFNIKYTFEDTT